ncbi:MAG: hypothetical protein HP006_09015 [Alistipes sp.]|nr:hypothetical protein [Alistipes sp.]
MQRTFIPGSEWLFFKIYTGHKSADEILVRYLYPAAERLKTEKAISDYFFIRYTDPKFHIRFRFRVPDVSNYGQVFRAIYDCLSPCMENAVIWNVLCDTYRREIERYGASSMELSERLFCMDSRHMLALLGLLADSQTAEQDRWQLSLRLIDDTLSAFGYTAEDKKELLEKMSAGFKTEFGFTNSTFNKQLNDKFRMQRKNVESVFDPETDPVGAYTAILDLRRGETKALAEQILPLTERERIEKDDYVRSVVHMTMNRLFRSKNRIYEMVIYDFLFRYYQSALAKIKYAKK